MQKLILRGIAANKGRLALTVISIVFGVAFVSGSFVLADSLRTVFDKLSQDIVAQSDASVRGVEPEFQTGESETRFDESVLDLVKNVDGVGLFEGGIGAFEQVYTTDADGEVVRPTGPPVLTFSWAGESPLSPFEIIEGAAPTGEEIAIDTAQAERGGFAVGDEVEVATATGGELESFTVSGLIEFPTPGAYFILFDLPTAQRVLGAEGKLDSIVLSAGPGVDKEAMISNVQAVLPEGVEVVGSEVVVNETQAEFGEFIDIFGYILLGFALVTLFVSIFIIYNTFAILVSQRTRQLGLLRCLGASGPQIRFMVLIEAFVIGIIASLIGLFAGFGVAAGLKFLLALGGGEFPDGPLELQPRTIFWVFVVGIVVTMVSALIPAVRASRIAPLEALRDGAEVERSMRFRLIAGAVVLVPGLILLILGFTGSGGSTTTVLTFLGFGSVLTFVGVSMLSALFAGAAASFIGQPAEALRNVVGRVARDNASRNPKRTAATSTSLMIGLALITGVTVLASSIKATFNDLLGDAISADLFIYEENQGLRFSGVLADDLQDLPEVAQAAGYLEMQVRVGEDIVDATSFDTAAGSTIVNLEILEGTIEVGPDGIAVSDDTVESSSLDLSLGDSIAVEFEDGFVADLTIEGIFESSSLIEGDWVLDRGLTREHTNEDSIDFVGLTYTEGFSNEEARAAVENVTGAFPQLSVQDNTEFQDSIAGQINSFLLLINGLLALCLVVAFFGIVNTMALSVLERTREIGLLRAVGMTRRQLRSSIRWEAVIVSIFGTLLGIGMGVVLAYAGIAAIPEDFITSTAIPWFSLAIYLAAGALLGVAAAALPARRAANMNVLEAIATA